MGWLGERQQGPVVHRPPSRLKIPEVHLQELSLRRVIYQNNSVLAFQPNNHDVVERLGFPRVLQADDERPAFGQMVLEVFGRAAKGKGAESILAEVALHFEGVHTFGLLAVERLLNAADVSGGGGG